MEKKCYAMIITRSYSKWKENTLKDITFSSISTKRKFCENVYRVSNFALIKFFQRLIKLKY